MALSDYYFSRSYSTDDVEKKPAKFYNTALKEAVVYKRIAGYFSSASFAVVSKGLKTFIENGGKMQFIFNVQLNEEDYENIMLGYETPKTIIESRFLEDLSNFQDECLHNHAKVLGWLIAQNILEVRIGYIDYENQIGLEPILHQKSGILEDRNGNILAFNGSNNESVSGWLYNTEAFNVFCSWLSGQEGYVEDTVESFKKYWEDRGDKTRVISFPEAVEKQLISIAPKNKEDLEQIIQSLVSDEEEERRVSDKKATYSKDTTIKIRDYQRKAIDAWVQNNHSGLFEMATGTGKTITASVAYKELLEKVENLVLVVTCPYTHLPAQWENTLKKLNIPDAIYLRADGNSQDWNGEIYQTCLKIKTLSRKKNIVILSTNDTASSPRFRKMYELIQEQCNFSWMLIADEVHSIGSKTYRQALYPEYQYRIGLSATPDRYFDDEGTGFIKEYFGGTVFQFTLGEAITSINPETGATYLVPYDYLVKFVRLNDDETEEYMKLTRNIVRLRGIIDSGKGSGKDIDNLNQMYNNRKRILKNAENKIEVLREILVDLVDKKELEHLLIYCSDTDTSQMENVMTLLNDVSKKKHRLIKFKKYTSDESSRISKKTGRSERDEILIDFDAGRLDALLAMKCLDEGVDVPSTKTAILMCSSGNSKEYIQRRGRILRPAPGKEKAILYDIAVLPPLGGKWGGLSSLQEIIEGEKKRMLEFSKDSLNQPDIEQLIDNQQNSYSGGR